jgi:hypothetical protein
MKKQHNIIYGIDTHLRLKIAAVSEGKTIGSVIKTMLDRCYPLDVSQRLSLTLIENDEEEKSNVI